MHFFILRIKHKFNRWCKSIPYSLLFFVLLCGGLIYWGSLKILRVSAVYTKENVQEKLMDFRTEPIDYAKRKRLIICKNITAELKSLPYPISYQSAISFDDTWGASRSTNADYNRNVSRIHEGCDLMYDANKPGVVPVLSMTDGVIEQMGWLTLGGYRIGIRSENGVYYYYAHLSSYADSLKVGDYVTAGQMLGFMGDTGYGEEGTTGKFPVHLHVGIYVNHLSARQLKIWFSTYPNGMFILDEQEMENEWEDISINPYPFLRDLSDSKK